MRRSSCDEIAAVVSSRDGDESLCAEREDAHGIQYANRRSCKAVASFSLVACRSARLKCATMQSREPRDIGIIASVTYHVEQYFHFFAQTVHLGVM